MLRNSSMSVTDVAYACGFSGTSYFCELFHRHYGITPNEYRKKNFIALWFSFFFVTVN